MVENIDSSTEAHVLNVRVPNEIALWLDEILKSKMYNSRSEVIRDLIRDYLKNKKSESIEDIK